MPKYKVTAPDGVYSVDAPNDDAAHAAVSQMFGGGGAAPAAEPAAPMPDPDVPTSAVAPELGNPAPRPPSLTDTIMSGANTAAYLPRGARRGLANIAGLPVDAVNAGLGLVGLPKSNNPFLGSKSIDDILGLPNEGVAAAVNAVTGRDTLHADIPPPSTVTQRVLSRTGEELGAAAVPVGASIHAGQMGVEAARKLPLLARMFVEPAAINPGAFAGKEAATAAAAGLGASGANEITHASGASPDGVVHKAADIAGALFGAGTLGAGRMVLGPVGNLSQLLTKSGRANFSNSMVKDSVVDRLANEASSTVKNADEAINTQPIIDAINRGARIDKTIPGFKESTADRTADPGLAALEYGRQTGSNSGLFTSRRGENTKAIDEAINQNAPQGSPAELRSALEAERGTRIGAAKTTAEDASNVAGNAAADVAPRYTPQARGATVRSAVDEALDRFTAETQAAHTTATRSADEAAGRIVPQSDPAVRGNVVRSALEDSRDTARARTEAAYDNVDVGGRQVDPVELRQGLDTVNDGLTATERGLVPQATIDRVRALGRVDEPVDGVAAAPPDPIKLKEATDLRSELLRMQRAALADPRAEKGGRNAARVIGQYVDNVEGFIRGSLTSEEIDALGAARTARTNEADAFGRAGDPVASVLARHEGGNPRVRDERVAGAFVSPATDAPLQRLFSEADTPAVRGAIRDEIVSKLPESARGNPDALDRFIADYDIPLRQFPGLRDEITAASTARRGAADAETAVTARRQEFSGDSRALADVSRRRSDGTPALLDEQVTAPFANPAGNRDLDALLSRADTPAVRTAIEDEMLGRAAGGMDKPERIRQFIADHTEPLKRFPGLQDRLEKAAAARGVERETATAADDLTRKLGTAERPGTSTVGKYLQYGDERAVDAMKGVLAHKSPGAAADELLNFVGDAPKAVEGARKAFWEIMQSKSRSAGETTKSMDGTQPWMPRAFKGFLDDPANKAVAERLYRDNPEHLDNLNKIADALQGVDVRTRAKAAGTTGTAQGVSNVLTAETVQSRFYAYKRGQTSLGFMVTALASVAARRAVRGSQGEAIEKLLDKSLLDPDLAAQLLKDNNPANRAALGRTAKAYLGNEASTVINLMAGSDKKEDPTVDTIMQGKK